MRLDVNNVISTIRPPINAQVPGYSPITSQIRIGARILSPKIRSATSALGIYLGPSTIKHVDAAINRLWNNAYWASKPSKINGLAQGKNTIQLINRANGVTGIIDLAFDFRAFVKDIP